jgi:hypothetical protein
MNGEIAPTILACYSHMLIVFLLDLDISPIFPFKVSEISPHMILESSPDILLIPNKKLRI